MQAKKGPTLRAQMLGHALRRLREQTGRTTRDVAGDLGQDQATVSRIETGFSPPAEDKVVALLNIYNVDDESERAVMLRLARDVWRRGWYDSYSDSMTEKVVEFTWLESRAVTIRSYYATVMPGLLQIRDYAHTVHEAVAEPGLDVDRVVEARMLRKQILTKEEPARYEGVLDEMLLRRPVGGPDVMRRQLEHLLELTKWPNVELRVLPVAVGAHASLDGAFEILELPSPYPAVGYSNTPAGIIYTETDGVERLDAIYDQLRTNAADPKESVALIRAAVKEFE